MGIVNFKKIMIATDGSACSELAADKGIAFARLSGGTVYAVHVLSKAYLSAMDGSAYSAVGTNPYWESVQEAFQKHGQQALNYVKDLGKIKEVNVESVMLEGNPADELIRYAEENKMDIVIMGTLGKSGIDRFILGSVTENILRHSKVPVMVVKEKYKPWAECK
jgi:nucleotide-binding universal stress UspA family protein